MGHRQVKPTIHHAPTSPTASNIPLAVISSAILLSVSQPSLIGLGTSLGRWLRFFLSTSLCPQLGNHDATSRARFSRRLKRFALRAHHVAASHGRALKGLYQGSIRYACRTFADRVFTLRGCETVTVNGYCVVCPQRAHRVLPMLSLTALLSRYVPKAPSAPHCYSSICLRPASNRAGDSLSKCRLTTV